MVSVFGSVYPRALSSTAGKTRADYLSQAGGPTRAPRGSIYVLRADGSVRASSKPGLHGVAGTLTPDAGDSIVVRKSFDRTTITRALKTSRRSSTVRLGAAAVEGYPGNSPAWQGRHVRAGSLGKSQRSSGEENASAGEGHQPARLSCFAKYKRMCFGSFVAGLWLNSQPVMPNIYLPSGSPSSAKRLAASACEPTRRCLGGLVAQRAVAWSESNDSLRGMLKSRTVRTA